MVKQESHMTVNKCHMISNSCYTSTEYCRLGSLFWLICWNISSQVYIWFSWEREREREREREHWNEGLFFFFRSHTFKIALSKLTIYTQTHQHVLILSKETYILIFMHTCNTPLEKYAIYDQFPNSGKLWCSSTVWLHSTQTYMYMYMHE